MSRLMCWLWMSMVFGLMQGAHAAAPAGVTFTHGDWELACDNTRTCRAAGYQRDGGLAENEIPVSVLLVRQAGPNQHVTGKIWFGELDAPAPVHPVMKINGRSLGVVALKPQTFVADLSDTQVQALLAALKRNSTIEWTEGKNIWRLSDQGAAAVLLKMDEFQGRIGTTGALIKPGPRDESAVLPPLPPPVIVAAALAPSAPGDDALAKTLRQALRAHLAQAKQDEECNEPQRDVSIIEKARVVRLTQTQVLVSARCWLGAYNEGYGYWVMNDVAPYAPVLVTSSGTDYEFGTISSRHKGRGIADCAATERWTWDGKSFVHSSSKTTGMCRLIALGGAWELPTLVTEVVDTKPQEKSKPAMP